MLQLPSVCLFIHITYTTKPYNVYFVQDMAWSFLYFKDSITVLYIRDGDFRLWLDIHCLTPYFFRIFKCKYACVNGLLAFLSGYS